MLVVTGKLQDYLMDGEGLEEKKVPDVVECNAASLSTPSCSDPIGTAGQDLRLPPLPREESR